MRLLGSLVFLCACVPQTTLDPPDASDAASAGDATPEASIDAPADVAADAPSPPVGTPGYCESQWKGPSILVLGVTVSGGSSLYRVYPESAWDEHVVDLVYNGKNLSIADVGMMGNILQVTNGAAWWSMSNPPPKGSHELGAPTPFGPNGTPPTLAYITPTNPWVGRGGTTFSQINPSPTVDWLERGSVLGPGTSCTAPRDFLSGSGLVSTYTYLATCGTDPNAVVTATATKDTNGNWTGTSSIGTLPNSQSVSGPVLAVSSTYYLTATKLYANGVFLRDLKVCLNDGNLTAPIGGLRTAITAQ